MKAAGVLSTNDVNGIIDVCMKAVMDKFWRKLQVHCNTKKMAAIKPAREIQPEIQESWVFGPPLPNLYD